MARVEAMMEALMRDRGLTMTPMGSIERDDSGSDGFRGDPAFSMPPLDPINPALVFLGQQPMFPQEPSNPTPAPVQSSGPPFDNTEQPHLVQLGNRTLPFPGPEEYQQYLLSFFTDIHLSHPCIDEADFRSHSEHMLASTIISPSESHFLALNYTIFACCDVLLSVAPTDGSKPRGWRWFELADHVLDKKSLLSGTGGLVLIQCVFYQVSYPTLISTSIIENSAEANTNHPRRYTIPFPICLVSPTTPSALLANSYSSTHYTSSLLGRTSPRPRLTSVYACSGTYSLSIV
jgi:hypothetical protein